MPSRSSLSVSELAWRKVRHEITPTLQDAMRQLPNYLSHLNLSRLPPQVVCPGSLLLNWLAVTRPGLSDLEQIAMAEDLLVWAAYRDAKTVWRIEPCLLDALSDCPWPDETPMTAIRLPSRCPVLEWQGPEGPIVVSACYDLLTGQEGTGKLELRLQWLHEQRWLPLAILYNDAPTLSAALEQAQAVALDAARQVQGAPLDIEAPFRSDLARMALILLLYLSGEPDMVKTVHPGAKPHRDVRMRRKDPERWADIREPTVWDVGVEYRKALERWEIEQTREIATHASDRSVRPHMRRAHAHLYWTGPGRTEPRVRFVLPIAVKGKQVEEEAATPIIQSIR
ncbi:MAG: hypothetical protein K8F29_12710 [Kofleriaceae bacterium]|nr:hypothetical protein [Candidatus Methylomirabilis lanthanidiphila]